MPSVPACRAAKDKGVEQKPRDIAQRDQVPRKWGGREQRLSLHGAAVFFEAFAPLLSIQRKEKCW